MYYLLEKKIPLTSPEEARKPTGPYGNPTNTDGWELLSPLLGIAAKQRCSEIPGTANVRQVLHKVFKALLDSPRPSAWKKGWELPTAWFWSWSPAVQTWVGVPRLSSRHLFSSAYNRVASVFSLICSVSSTCSPYHSLCLLLGFFCSYLYRITNAQTFFDFWFTSRKAPI